MHGRPRIPRGRSSEGAMARGLFSRNVATAGLCRRCHCGRKGTSQRGQSNPIRSNHPVDYSGRQQPCSLQCLASRAVRSATAVLACSTPFCAFPPSAAGSTCSLRSSLRDAVSSISDNAVLVEQMRFCSVTYVPPVCMPSRRIGGQGSGCYRSRPSGRLAAGAAGLPRRAWLRSLRASLLLRSRWKRALSPLRAEMAP
jgi:hypothetical protein